MVLLTPTTATSGLAGLVRTAKDTIEKLLSALEELRRPADRQSQQRPDPLVSTRLAGVRHLWCTVTRLAHAI
jgi:hypothetical protein